MKQIATFALGAFLMASLSAVGKDSSTPAPFQKTLSGVPAAEMPAKAADLVKQTKAREWGTRTVDVVKSALAINPAAAPAVVAAIAKAVPEMASIAAGTAATEQPKQAAAITKAAVAAAPSKAGKVVTAVCRAVPSEYRTVALAASEAAPTAAKEILNAVGTAIPSLRSGIDKTLASHQGTIPPVGPSLDQALTTTVASTDKAAGPLPKGPTQGAPFLPLSGTPTLLTPTTSGNVPPGGRDYASP
jgi:hypothetical protein